MEEIELAQKKMAEKVTRYELFIKSLLHPEVYGMTVNAEIRDAARYVLGMPKVETSRRER